MVDLSEQGAQFVITIDNVQPRFILDDIIELSIKISYGMAAVNSLVRWFDPQSNHLGVTFTKQLDNPSDPLSNCSLIQYFKK
jgi:hypothetical protein